MNGEIGDDYESSDHRTRATRPANRAGLSNIVLAVAVFVVFAIVALFVIAIWFGSALRDF